MPARTVSGKVDTKQRGVMTEAQLIAAPVGFGIQLLPYQPAGADQHQVVDQLAGTGRGRSVIDEHQGLLAGFGQVCGDGWAITRCAGDQCVERCTPGVHGVGNQLDLFERNLRLVGHGSDPRCCCGWGLGRRF